MATAAHTIHPTRLADPDRHPRLAANRRLLNALYLTAVAVIALLVAACTVLHGAEILKNAGLLNAGSISGLSSLVSSVMNSVKWYAATLAGLSGAVIAAMFVSGHQSAHSHGMRVGFGIIAIVCIPALVS